MAKVYNNYQYVEKLSINICIFQTLCFIKFTKSYANKYMY